MDRDDASPSVHALSHWVRTGFCRSVSYCPSRRHSKVLLSLAYAGFVFMCVVLRRHFGSDARLDWLFLPGFALCLRVAFSHSSWRRRSDCVSSWSQVAMRMIVPLAARRLIIALGLVLLASHALVFLLGWTVGVLLPRRANAAEAVGARCVAVRGARSRVCFAVPHGQNSRARRRDSWRLEVQFRLWIAQTAQGTAVHRRLQNSARYTSWLRLRYCMHRGCLVCASGRGAVAFGCPSS